MLQHTGFKLSVRAMVRELFKHVDQWVFDLDHTLYPPSARLFDQIEAKMSHWIMQALDVARAEADRLRDTYWKTYGTTLAGLMTEHNVDPGPYLDVVHDISFDILEPDPALRAQIDALPGRRIVYTNGPTKYAGQVIEARGLAGVFDAVYSVEDADLLPKPDRAAFEKVFEKAGVDPARAAMFEDTTDNLIVPHAMGMRTVHVGPAADPQPHIHHHTDDLAGFLSQLAQS